MRNAQISKILFESNNKDSYLWDLPRPKWKEVDFYNLSQIQANREVKNRRVKDFVEFDEKQIAKSNAQNKNKKLILRKSDGKIFQGINHCSRETGISRASLSNTLNKHPKAIKKYINEFEFI